MSLSCECDGGYDWYYDNPEDYSALNTSKRKRCISCEKLINIGELSVEFRRWREPVTEIEESIEGDTVRLASKYMCEECGDLFFSLKELGFCIGIGFSSMKELIEEYNLKYSPKQTINKYQSIKGEL